MIVSESALREWVKLPSRETVIEDLTMLGLEVDGVEPVAGVFDNVVVGQVVECAQHPNADKLRVTKVNIGEPELLDIVCGAPNCRQGIKVCVSKVGANLPNGIKIKATKLRGHPSNGMLCSYNELNINCECAGIVELPQDAPIGEDVRKYLDLEDITVEIGLTANRADCLSQLGVARDLGAKYNTPTNFEQFKADLFAQDRTTIQDVVPVDIQNPSACPAYASRVIRNVNTKAETPIEMVQYLARMGVRSIDPIVDITNYVLHKLGYPMHAFDANLITDKLVVRDAKDQESLVLLSEQEVKLDPNTLVIADGDQAVALAGIFGGNDKSINDNTKDIVLECAFFNPLAIVNRARQYGLHTDSSHRFERGVDPQMLPVALEYATKLILDICGGQAGPVNLVGELPENVNHITCSHQLIERIAGIHYDSQKVVDILVALGCTVEHDSENSLYRVQTPSWRWDLAIPEDLAEEVIRIDGYENIPAQAPQAELVMRSHREKNLPLNRVKDVLINRDFQEVVTYSFVDPKLQSLFHKDQPTLDLPNPISVEMSQMRLSLFTNLLNVLSHNLKRQAKNVRIFETGLTFTPNEDAELGVAQELVLGGLVTGTAEPESWIAKGKTVDFFDVKGIVEDILTITLGHHLNQITYTATKQAGFHPGQTAQILLNNEPVGIIGKVHPNLHKPFGVKGDIFLFSLDHKAIEFTHVPDVKAISKFPFNKRDISLVIDQEIPVGELLRFAKQAGGNLLQDVSLFDIFQDASLGEGKKSIALTLIIGDQEKTLEEREIADEVAQVVRALSDKYAAVLREV